MARYQPHHKRSSVWKRILLWVLATVTAALVAIVVFREPVLELGLRVALENQGLAPVAVSLEEASLSAIRVSQISMADGRIEASSAEIRYAFSTLLQPKIESATVTDFRMRGDWDENGVSFGPLDRLFGGAEQPSQDTDSSDITDQAATGDEETFPLGTFQIDNASLILNRPDGEFAASANVSLAVTDRIFSVNATLQIDGPGLTGNFSWQGRVNPSDIATLEGNGNLQVDADDFVIPGQEDRIDVDIDLGAKADQEGIALNLNRDLALRVPASIFGASEPDATQTPLDLRLQSEQVGVPLLSVKPVTNGLRADGNLALQWTSPVGSGEVAFAGFMDFNQDNLPQDFLFERLSFSTEDLATPYGVVSGTFNGDGLHGPLAVAEGPVSFAGSISAGRLNPLAFDQLDVEVNALFRLDGLSLALDLTDLSLQANSGTFGETARWTETAHVNLVPSAAAAQTVTTVFGADGSATVTFDTGISVDTGPAFIGNEAESTQVSVKSPSVAIEGFWVAGDPEIEFAVSVDQAEVSSEAWRLSALSIESQGNTSSLDGDVSGRLTLLSPDSVNRTGLPVSARFTWDNGQFESAGTLTTRDGRPLASYESAVAVSDSDGRVALKAGPLIFGGSEISASDVYPLGLPFVPVSGELAADLILPLGSSALPGNGRVFAKDLELETGALRIQRLNTVLQIDSTRPIMLTEPQSVAIGLVQAGVPISNVVAEFSLQEKNELVVSEFYSDFAGGTVTGGPVSMDMSAVEKTIPLRVSGVLLPRLAELSGLQGLKAEGELSGEIPLTLSGDDALVSDGILRTNGPGRIRYVSETGPQQSVGAAGGLSLALQAMEDFRYESLALTISGSIMKELQVGIAIKGNNPNLYGGYPIDFNLNVEGELANVVRGSLTGYRVPESIRQQLMAFPSAQ